MSNVVLHTCRLWNMYGPAETTIDCTFHLFDNTTETESFSIGRPLSKYQNLVLDQFSQSVFMYQEGELFVGGIGVFAGYLGRDDLTAQALVEIDDELYYRTGDLVRMDNNGLLHYQGRQDHQIKLHGQRIELGEIERCLLNITSISACVVMKWNDDYLVAYVQSSDINEQKLREHCQSHLPQHMIPSIFIILDKFPLNANGKVDRKQLPSPDFSSSTLLSSDKSDTPLNQFEERIHTIWCEVLHSNENHISRTTSFFSVGGHSLLLIQLYHRYQSIFSFTNKLLPIALFLQKTTIIEHAKLLESIKSTDVVIEETWQSLHLIKGIASFAQERIFLDQQVRFMNNASVYNELMVLKLINDTLSKSRLQRAIQSVLEKHQILRTCLILDTNAGTLTQCVTQNHLIFMFNTEKTFKNDDELNSIIFQIKTNPNLFNLFSGHVFCCEILRQNSSIQNDDLLQESDILVFAFHHVAYDR
ncbi:unnamed protein product, partial [Adineta steineri]